jgi:hypothetical protein
MLIQYVNIIMALTKHFKQLLDDHWSFLDAGWPTITPRNNHRTVSKEIGFMAQIKETLNRRLGPIPVYFFLVVIWPKCKYPGPYKEVEKGVIATERRREVRGKRIETRDKRIETRDKRIETSERGKKR